MTVKKLFTVALSALFLVGPALVATAQEKKMEDKKAEATPAKPVAKSKYANGTVKTATPDSLTVVGKDQKEWTFAVDTKTFIKKADKAVVVTDLKEGDPVHVRFTEADSKLRATSITVKAGGIAKKEAKTEKKGEK